MSKKKTLKTKRSIELLLLSRLKWLGYILYLWGLGFFVYAIIETLELPPPSVEILDSYEETQKSYPLVFYHFFLLSALFAGLASLCLFVAKKRLPSNKK